MPVIHCKTYHEEPLLKTNEVVSWGFVKISNVDKTRSWFFFCWKNVQNTISNNFQQKISVLACMVCIYLTRWLLNGPHQSDDALTRGPRFIESAILNVAKFLFISYAYMYTWINYYIIPFKMHIFWVIVFFSLLWNLNCLLWAPLPENLSLGFLTRSDVNQAVQLWNMARDLKICI